MRKIKLIMPAKMGKLCGVIRSLCGLEFDESPYILVGLGQRCFKSVIIHTTEVHERFKIVLWASLIM